MGMDHNSKYHETQADTSYSEVEAAHIQSTFEDSQRIEGGGPPKKLDIASLPTPIRILGWLFIVVMMVMVVFALITNWL